MTRIILVMGGLGASALAFAHHGWSEYDSSQVLKLTGKIVESGYEHPHGHVRLEAPGKTWEVVLAPPSRMERRGLEKGALKPGATVTVAPGLRAPFSRPRRSMREGGASTTSHVFPSASSRTCPCGCS